MSQSPLYPYLFEGPMGVLTTAPVMPFIGEEKHRRPITMWARGYINHLPFVIGAGMLGNKFRFLVPQRGKSHVDIDFPTAVKDVYSRWVHSGAIGSLDISDANQLIVFAPEITCVSGKELMDLYSHHGWDTQFLTAKITPRENVADSVRYLMDVCAVEGLWHDDEHDCARFTLEHHQTAYGKMLSYQVMKEIDRVLKTGGKKGPVAQVSRKSA